MRSERDEVPLRTALADAAPVFWQSRDAAAYRRTALRRFLAFWREALPGTQSRERLRFVYDVMTMIVSAGERMGDERRPVGDADAFAEAVARMVCTYLETAVNVSSKCQAGRRTTRP